MRVFGESGGLRAHAGGSYLKSRPWKIPPNKKNGARSPDNISFTPRIITKLRLKKAGKNYLWKKPPICLFNYGINSRGEKKILRGRSCGLIYRHLLNDGGGGVIFLDNGPL